MESVISIILTSFYIFLPAYIATSLPLVAAGFHILEGLNIPIDGRKKIGSFRLLGDNKTVRGFLVGIGGGIGIAFCQHLLTLNGVNLPNHVIDFTNLGQTLLFGFLMSSGSLIGDALESMLKRQMNIAPGESLIIADQIDYILGAVLFSSPFFKIPLQYILVYCVLAFVLHLLSGVFSKVIGMNRKWI